MRVCGGCTQRTVIARESLMEKANSDVMKAHSSGSAPFTSRPMRPRLVRSRRLPNRETVSKQDHYHEGGAYLTQRAMCR